MNAYLPVLSVFEDLTSCDASIRYDNFLWKALAPKRVFATTILRKFNQQWRVMVHHASRFSSSPYTGDQRKSSTSAMSANNASRLKKAGSTKTGERVEKDSAAKGNVPTQVVM